MNTILRFQPGFMSVVSAIAATLIVQGAIPPQSLMAGEPEHKVSVPSSYTVKPLDLVLGKSSIVDVPASIKRASLADPAIADALVLSPKQLYVTGKSYGSTNLTLWGKNDQILAIYDLEVGVDVTRLKQQFRHLLPEETNIHPRSSHDHLTLTGTISSPAKLSQALALAEAFAPKRVINLLKIYPEEPDSAGPGELNHVTIEVIRGTAVNSVKF